jgi:hypothetical protein
MTLAGRNVTVDPLSAATPVADPEIDEVIDLETGDIHSAPRLIASLRYDALVTLRMRIQESLKQETALYACPICTTPVYIVANQQKHFFFRHLVEDGSRPAETRGLLSEAEIRARKYHGLRESEAHKRMKAHIARSICADARFSGTSVLQERRWRSGLIQEGGGSPMCKTSAASNGSRSRRSCPQPF